MFARLDPQTLNERFSEWVQALNRRSAGEVISIGGKTARRSHDAAHGRSALHMVSAWASKTGLTLAQRRVNEKPNEITAIPELLEMLEFSGCVVTIDAIGTEKSIAERIIDGEGEYVLALKGNHPTLEDAVGLYFADELTREGEKSKNSEPEIDYYKSVDTAYGRVEARECWASGVVTGPIRLCYRNPNRLTPAELHEKRFAFAQNIRTEPDYVPTANWFSYRSVIVDAGLFNSSLRSGGDLELSRRLAAEGYRLLGVSRAVVLHPARARISELLHKEARTFGGKVTQAGGKRTTRVILRSAKQRMTKHAARLGDVLRNRGLFATKRERSWCAVITVFILLVVGLEAVRLLFGGAAKR